MRKLYFLVVCLFIFSEVKTQIVNIPDANFKAKLISLGIDKNNNGEIEVDEAKNVKQLVINNSNISSLEGISSFINLFYLDCSSNAIESLNLGGLLTLNTLLCHSNKLTSLNLVEIPELSNLVCGSNFLKNIDASNLLGLCLLHCENNPYLEFISVKGNSFCVFESNFSNNPKLVYVCANEKDIDDFGSYFLRNGITGVNVNSYCSFIPGGTFYTIQGTTKLNTNGNGCDVLDLPLSNLKFSITDGTISGSTIANITGNYAIPVQSGTFTVTPVLENLSYFTVSPTNTVVTFPTQTSPFNQDFCVTPNGVHPDLEVTVLPINRARPGFDATYKIIYKNKGNQTQSGALNLTFNDAVLDVVIANPTVANQTTNNLSWNFSDLKPFETREIEVTLNVNSPMETPAVNNNDILSYTATITSTQTDDTPTDNTFTLNQTVVGSYDPNDKTCLEGPTILPSAVGKYVHYLIRFENKGTAEAQNVVVKDMIDTSKFDVTSLIVTQGSHPFVTRITETNKVEFIFENINLPFEDATNDGYVAFKIKTNPSLVVGDSFSNTASIYFDYNFPIVTNTATTSVLQSLGTNDFEFDSYFSVYPNPAKNSLNVDIKKQIKVSSISIYNTLGQQILVIPNAQYTKQVDVSNLKTGNYFIKLTSDKGSSVGKFLKS